MDQPREEEESGSDDINASGTNRFQLYSDRSELFEILPLGSRRFSDSSSSHQSWMKVEGWGKAWGKISTNLSTDLDDAVKRFWNVSTLNELFGDTFKLEQVSVIPSPVIRVLGREEQLSPMSSFQECEKIVKMTERVENQHQIIYFSKMRLYELNKQLTLITVEPKGDHGEVTSDAPNTVNAITTATIRFHKVGEKLTKVEMVTSIELGDQVSKSVTKASLKKHLSIVTEAGFRLTKTLSSSEASAEDGRLIGEDMMRRVKERAKEKTIDDVVKESVASNRTLREMIEEFSFVEPLLCAVVASKLCSVAKVESKAEACGVKEGRAIGKSLAISLATTLTATIACDEWILQYPALQDLDSEYAWFRPMLESIAYKLVGEVSWGVKMRVVTGAIMSISDLMTDIYVGVAYYAESRFAYFEAIMIMLGLSIFFQILIVLLCNYRRGFKTVLFEVLPVIIGMKPAVDAYRIGYGVQQEVGQSMAPELEMTYIKGIELFAESIPGVIIQIVAFATANNAVTYQAWMSLVISALSTGFISASISYDWDTDPKRRKQTPNFYGYVPARASKRTVVFGSMVCFSTGMLLIRCMTIMILGLMGKRWVFIYLGADLCLYLLIKALRGDFWYWMPLGGGTMEILSTLVARFLCKIVTDFTSIIQFRHPNEVGGANWSFSTVLTMISLSCAIEIYRAWGGEDHVVEGTARAAKIVIPMTAAAFLVFFYYIEKEYLGTFFTFQRGKDLAIKNFREGKDDETKAAYSFEVSQHYWKEEEVQEWVEENWNKWEIEKPQWLDDAMRARIPKHIIPNVRNPRGTGMSKRNKIVPTDTLVLTDDLV